ncbi:hypothetical protein MN0502_09330 [Arthrobacter sp. MN05-02]|nr:hypothetical protein MN0502_09330 [Arthrobacter sp. MN05-02]
MPKISAPRRPQGITRHAEQHQAEVQQGEGRIADDRDHKELHGTWRRTDLAALEQGEGDAEDDQRSQQRLDRDAREHAFEEHGQAAEEEALEARVGQDQRRRRLTLEGVDETEHETAEGTQHHEGKGEARKEERRNRGSHQDDTQGQERLDDHVVERHPARLGGAGGRLVVHVLQLLLVRDGLTRVGRGTEACRRVAPGSGTEILPVENRITAKCHFCSPPIGG